MYCGNCEKEAMLYYFYMMADGEISTNEITIFNDICKELNIYNDSKNSIINECKEYLAKTKNVFSIIKDENFDELLGRGWFGINDNSVRVRIIWNLINLGYADAYFSEEEEKIVNYLSDKWSINSELYSEFIDTADTILALTKQKDWLNSTYFTNHKVEGKVDYIESEIKHLIKAVNVTIEEFSM